MQALLLSLYPKVWREQYGDEYGVLLEDTELSPANVLDIMKAACLLRLKAHEKSLHLLIALSLYALSGFVCLRLGLTDNWPLWAPTNPARAAGLIVTLTPLAYALYIRFSSLHDSQQQWHGSALVYWLVASPLTVISTVLSAFICGFFLLGTGIITLAGDRTPFVTGVVLMVVISAVLIKLLNSLQGWLLQRFST